MLRLIARRWKLFATCLCFAVAWPTAAATSWQSLIVGGRKAETKLAWKEAERLYSEAASVAASYGEEDPRLSSSRRELGRLYSTTPLLDLEKAEHAYQEDLKTLEKFDEDYIGQAEDLCHLAEIRVFRTYFDQAADDFRKAEAIYSRAAALKLPIKARYPLNAVCLEVLSAKFAVQHDLRLSQLCRVLALEKEAKLAAIHHYGARLRQEGFTSLLFASREYDRVLALVALLGQGMSSFELANALNIMSGWLPPDRQADIDLVRECAARLQKERHFGSESSDSMCMALAIQIQQAEEKSAPKILQQFSSWRQVQHGSKEEFAANLGLLCETWCKGRDAQSEAYTVQCYEEAVQILKELGRYKKAALLAARLAASYRWQHRDKESAQMKLKQLELCKQSGSSFRKPSEMTEREKKVQNERKR